jgi:FkbM family methyltransferase
MDLYQPQLATWSRAKLEAGIKRRTQTAYLGDGVVLARILGRHKIFLQSSDRGFACHLMLDGYWEIWLTQFLARHVRQGMTVIDVGANFGYYTLLLADAVGSTGQVVAVEPNPATVALLRESIQLNGYTDRTTIVPCALSAQAGNALLFCPDGEPKNAGLVSHKGRPGGTTIEVPTVTLDAITKGMRKIDLVKIDAEGAELAIVGGMQELIKRDHPAIVLEFNAARYSDPNAFLESLVKSYSSVQEISLDGTFLPLDSASVTDKASLQDRLLLFQ